MTDFDVFLAHNSRDKPAIKRLARALQQRDIRYWLDLERLRPGLSWQKLMEQGITSSASIAVCIGGDGIGPWERHEMEAALRLGVDQDLPVIPVLLPGAAGQPKLPLFLGNLMWVDLRDGLRKEGLDALIWGITGDRPGSTSGEIPDDDSEAAYLRALRERDYLRQPDLYIRLQGDHRQRQPQLARAAARLFMCPQLSYQPRPTPDQDPSSAGPAAEARSFDDILEALPDIQRVVLLGDPGAGKTTSLWKLTHEALDCIGTGPASRDRPLPLMARLGDWIEPDQDLLSFLADQSGLAVTRIQHYLDQRQLLLLLDGLNEIPVEQRQAKAAAIRALIDSEPKPRTVISCRGPDYRDALRLPLDTLSIRPLTPGRVRGFLQAYLPAIAVAEGQSRADGEAWAEQLFWELAGGGDIEQLWRTWRQAGVELDGFWSTQDIQRDQPAVWEKTSGAEDRLWRERVASPYNLMRLAENPFLLSRLVLVWLHENRRHLPANRGQLFELFTLDLLQREGLIDGADPPGLTDAGRALLEGLGELAWRLQTQDPAQPSDHNGDDNGDDGDGDGDGASDRPETARTSLPLSEARALLGQRRLDQGLATSLLDGGATLRFGHQLIQEYFTALGMRERLQRGRLDATRFWPPDHWWRRSGWEEAAVLLAGLYHQDCSPVLEWLAEAQPVVAADYGWRARPISQGNPTPRLARRSVWRWAQSATPVAVSGSTPRACRGSTGSRSSPTRALSINRASARPNGLTWIPSTSPAIRSPTPSFKPLSRPGMGMRTALGGPGSTTSLSDRASRTGLTPTAHARASPGIRPWPFAAGCRRA